MKLCLLVLILSFPALFATAQSSTVTLRLKHLSLKEIFQRLEQETPYRFLYRSADVTGIQVPSLDVREAGIDAVMQQCLAGTSLTWIKDEMLIIVKPKKALPPEQRILHLTGKVTDREGHPLPGVTVIVKGASIGVATDGEGRFKMELPETEGLTLLFSFVGMKAQEVAYRGQKSIDVTMEEDVSMMDEVVITGYQTLSRRELASAVTQVKAGEVMLNSQFSIDQMLVGQIPGMSVMRTSGEPSATPRIRIRGTSSLIGNKAPLWVLDGIILEDPVDIDYTQLNGDDAAYLVGNAIGGVNPRDIETITVLKDASATAIYGVRAANGVIVVTTKKGKVGAPLLSYSASFSVNRRPCYGDFNLMNAGERIQLSQEIIERNIKYGRIPRHLGYEGLYIDYMNKQLSYDEFNVAVQRMAQRNTDWYDLLFRNAFSHNHSLSFSGGTQTATYYASVGFDDSQGTANGSSSKRYTAMLKLNAWLTKKTNLVVQLNGSVNKSLGFHSSVNPNRYAYETARTIPCYEENGDLFYYSTRQRDLALSSQNLRENLYYNVLNEMSATGQEGRVTNLTGKVDFVWKIWNGLEYRFAGSYAHQQTKSSEWAREESNYVSTKRGYNLGSLAPDSEEENGSAIPLGGILSKSENERITYSLRNTVAYNNAFAQDHVVSVMFASEIRSTSANGLAATYYGWQPDRGQTISPVITDEYTSALSGLAPRLTDNVSNYVSWLGSASYTYRDKLTLNGNIRMDGSNNFGDNPKYRFLPIWSLAGKYTLTGAPFLRQHKVLTYLAVRGSYGIQGNVDKASSPDLVIQIGKVNAVTRQEESSIKYLANPSLRWEKTKSYNIGLEFSLWDNRLSGTWDYYHKRGVDIIMNKQISQVFGGTLWKINGGRLSNSGIEGNLRVYPVKTDDWEWSVNVIYSYNRNKLLEANDEMTLTNADKLSGQALVVGEPVGVFYSYKFAGLRHEDGYPEFYDDRGQKGNALYADHALLVKSGPKDPKVTGGFDVYVRYKRLRLGAGFTYALGGYGRLPNIYRNDYYAVFDPLVNVTKELTQRWRKPGDEAHTIFPVLFDDDYYASIRDKDLLEGTVYYGNRLFDFCDARVAKTDNLRLRSLSLSYLLPEKFTRKLGIESLSMNVQAENLFLLTAKEWHGRDPESGDSNVPIPKTYTVGLNVSF